MAGYIHPDKKPLIYGEWKAVVEILDRKATADTEELKRTVTVPELIRGATLKLANEILSEWGESLLNLDPSSSTSSHRGMRVANGELVEKEQPRAPKRQVLEIPAGVDTKMFTKMYEAFVAMQKPTKVKKAA